MTFPALAISPGAADSIKSPAVPINELPKLLSIEVELFIFASSFDSGTIVGGTFDITFYRSVNNSEGYLLETELTGDSS